MPSPTFNLVARGGRRLVPGIAAVILSFIVAGTALGAGWGTPKRLSGVNLANAVDIVTVSSLKAVAAYEESNSAETILARRTGNGGASWGAPVTLAADGNFPDLASNGVKVDLVYNTSDGRVWYRRSTNGGATFDPAIAISPAGRFNWRPAVGRGPGGVVAVAYVDAGSGNLAVRISTDGGVTFAPRDVLSRNADDQTVAVGIGTGVTYVAYSIGFSSVRIKHTNNNGATWSSAAVLTNSEWDGEISVAAEGSHAYVGYSVPGSAAFSHARYRRTLNSGSTWSGQFDLAPGTWSTSDPSLALAGGVLRAAFSRCTPEFDICVDSRIYYRRSTNGTSWSTAQRVSPSGLLDATSPAVGEFGAIVTYIADNGSNLIAFARAKV